MKKILLFALVIFVISCEKPSEKGYCVVKSKLAENSYHLDYSYDTLQWDVNKNFMSIQFNLIRLEPSPPCEYEDIHDTIIGNIDYINVIANYYLPNDTIIDTINDLLEVQIINVDDVVTYPLDQVRNKNPFCGEYLIFSFVNPPMLNCSQSYYIYYKSKNSNEYPVQSAHFYITQ